MRDWSPLPVARQRVGRFTGATVAAEDAYYAFFADDEGTLAGFWGAVRAAVRRVFERSGVGSQIELLRLLIGLGV